MRMLIIIMTLSVCSQLNAENLNELFTKAAALEKKGDKTLDLDERKVAYNEALALYSSVRSPESPFLNSAIARLFFKLEEFPWSILYSRRALKSGANDPSLKMILEKSKAILGIDSLQVPGRSLNHYFSLESKYALFLWGMIINCILFSLLIWSTFPSKWLRNTAYGVGFSGFFLLINIALSYYLAPLKAIMVSDTGFYRETTRQSSQITIKPIFAGQSVNILEDSEKGEWLKIVNTDGLTGYIPSSTARII